MCRVEAVACGWTQPESNCFCVAAAPALSSGWYMHVMPAWSSMHDALQRLRCDLGLAELNSCMCCSLQPRAGEPCQAACKVLHRRISSTCRCVLTMAPQTDQVLADVIPREVYCISHDGRWHVRACFCGKIESNCRACLGNEMPAGVKMPAKHAAIGHGTRNLCRCPYARQAVHADVPWCTGDSATQCSVPRQASPSSASQHLQQWARSREQQPQTQTCTSVRPWQQARGRHAGWSEMGQWQSAIQQSAHAGKLSRARCAAATCSAEQRCTARQRKVSSICPS